MNGANATVGNAAVALADFVMNVAGGEHRPLAAFDVELIEPAFDAALASVQLSAYLNFHSKSLSLLRWMKSLTLFKHRRRPGDFEIFSFLRKKPLKVRLFKD